MRRNVGGLCDNCGLPAHVHTVDRCPSEEQASRLQESIDRWESIVRPAREAYQQAHADAKQLRRNVRRGLATEDAYRGAERAADAAWGRYQAAIRQADRESGD